MNWWYIDTWLTECEVCRLTDSECNYKATGWVWLHWEFLKPSHNRAQSPGPHWNWQYGQNRYTIMQPSSHRLMKTDLTPAEFIAGIHFLLTLEKLQSHDMRSPRRPNHSLPTHRANEAVMYAHSCLSSLDLCWAGLDQLSCSTGKTHRLWLRPINLHNHWSKPVDHTYKTSHVLCVGFLCVCFFQMDSWAQCKMYALFLIFTCPTNIWKLFRDF